MGLAEDLPCLGFHGQIAMGHRLFTQKVIGALNAKASGVQHHQNFRKQRFDRRFSSFAGDQVRNFGFFLMQKPLKIA